MTGPVVTILQRPVIVEIADLTGAGVVALPYPGQEITIDPVGMQGPPGLPAARYTHGQGSAAALWTVNHNLGFYPQVTVLSPGGLELTAAIQHVSINQALVAFNIPTAGTAECS